MDDLKYEQKYGKGPLLIERAERLKRLQELKENMNQRAAAAAANNERGESDDGAIRMIKDTRMKRIGDDVGGGPYHRRTPSSNLDIIHKNRNADAQILYADDPVGSNLPSIHGSQLGNGRGSHAAAYQHYGQAQLP